jgi:hypothetical protein
MPALVSHIDSQAEHHKDVSFEEEYRLLLSGAGVAFDEKYVWE